MLVFIDDSGDAGFNLKKGSTKFFVIALIIFDDELIAEEVALEIKKLRRELKFPEEMEFKFNKSRRIVIEQFLKRVNKFNFKVRCLIVDKSLIRSPELRSNKNSFYSYAIKTALSYNDGSILDAKVRIDGSGDRVFKRSFLTYLRRQLNSEQRKVMKNCQLINSKSNVLIQMADMIAGSIRRSYDKTKNDSDVYKSLFRKHIEDEWEFK